MQALIGYIENDMQICFPYNLHKKKTESWNKVLSVFYIAISYTVMTSLVLITTVSIEIIELYTANQAEPSYYEMCYIFRLTDTRLDYTIME